MLHIQTFDARAGGNVIYKALAHPLAAEAIARLYATLSGPVAIYDPDGIADALLALYPTPIDALFVHDVGQVGQVRGGLTARPLTDLPANGAATVLIAAFDASRILARIAELIPPEPRS